MKRHIMRLTTIIWSTNKNNVLLECGYIEHVSKPEIVIELTMKGTDNFLRE